jgi:carbon monoxide dehydrogenase subunit G
LHLEGNYGISRSQATVWDFISDPKQIAHCLPDLQSLDVKDRTHFSVTVKVGIAFVRGTFKFDFTLLDQTPPSHSKFEAVGRGAGVSVRLDATMDLKETAKAMTELNWKCDAQLGGLLGEVSPSLIRASADKFTRDFFECIRVKLESHSA